MHTTAVQESPRAAALVQRRPYYLIDLEQYEIRISGFTTLVQFRDKDFSAIVSASDGR